MHKFRKKILTYFEVCKVKKRNRLDVHRHFWKRFFWKTSYSKTVIFTLHHRCSDTASASETKPTNNQPPNAHTSNSRLYTHYIYIEFPVNISSLIEKQWSKHYPILMTSAFLTRDVSLSNLFVWISRNFIWMYFFICFFNILPLKAMSKYLALRIFVTEQTMRSYGLFTICDDLAKLGWIPSYQYRRSYRWIFRRNFVPI